MSILFPLWLLDAPICCLNHVESSFLLVKPLYLVVNSSCLFVKSCYLLDLILSYFFLLRSSDMSFRQHHHSFSIDSRKKTIFLAEIRLNQPVSLSTTTIFPCHPQPKMVSCCSLSASATSARSSSSSGGSVFSAGSLVLDHVQWEFQDPEKEVLYHIRPYFVGIFPYIGLM